jgi:hypothetical protein
MVPTAEGTLILAATCIATSRHYSSNKRPACHLSSSPSPWPASRKVRAPSLGVLSSAPQWRQEMPRASGPFQVLMAQGGGTLICCCCCCSLVGKMNAPCSSVVGGMVGGIPAGDSTSFSPRTSTFIWRPAAALSRVRASNVDAFPAIRNRSSSSCPPSAVLFWAAYATLSRPRAILGPAARYSGAGRALFWGRPRAFLGPAARFSGAGRALF